MESKMAFTYGNSMVKEFILCNTKKGKINFQKGFTAPNRKVYASPLKRLGLRKNPVGLRPLWVFSPPHFCGCWNCFAVPLSQPQKRHL